MKLILALAMLMPNLAFASKLVNQDVRQYFPSVGLGSTQSVAYTSTAGVTAQILSPNGGNTELVSVLVTTAAYVAQGASPVAAASDMLVPANTPMLIEMLAGNKVSAVPLSNNGTLYVTHLITFPNGK